MTDLETKLAEAREGVMPNDVSEMAASHRRAFDAAAAIAREVVAEKDAEIVRLKTDIDCAEQFERSLRDDNARKSAEIARLEATMRK
jgi:hypothetical protein